MQSASLLALVAICRWQLRQQLRLRLGWLLGWSIAGVSCSLLLLAPELGRVILRGSLVAGMWLVAGPAALALADDPARRDRLDGMDVLLRARGVPMRTLVFCRVLAGAAAIFVRLAGPLSCVSVLVAITLGPTLALAWLALLVLFGPFFALLFSSLALTCGYGAAQRGQSFFLISVLLPWLLADSYQLGQLWSLPGLLMLSMEAVEKLVVFG